MSCCACGSKTKEDNKERPLQDASERRKCTDVLVLVIFGGDPRDSLSAEIGKLNALCDRSFSYWHDYHYVHILCKW